MLRLHSDRNLRGARLGSALLASFVILALAGAASADDVYLEVLAKPLGDPLDAAELGRAVAGPIELPVPADALALLDVGGLSALPDVVVADGAALSWIDFEADADVVAGTLPAAPGAVSAMAAIDYRGSARTDLVVAVGSQLWVYDLDAPAAWRGPWGTPLVPTSLAAADVLGDDREELVVSDGAELRAGEITGEAPRWRTLPPPPVEPRSLAAVDAMETTSPTGPVGSERYLSAGSGRDAWLFVPGEDGAQGRWEGPVERRFALGRAAPGFQELDGETRGTMMTIEPIARSRIRLHEVAAESGLADTDDPGGDPHCPGAVFADLDGDDLPDVYLPRGRGSNGGTANRLFLGSPGGVFAEAADLGAADPGNGAGALALDFDNDGDRDLYVLNFDGSNVLLENRGGRFVDVTATTDPTPADPPGDHQEGLAHGVSFDRCEPGEVPPCRLDDSLAAAAGDFDRDGLLDLYVGTQVCCAHTPDAEGERDVLYRQEPGGRFRDVTVSAGIAPAVETGSHSSTQAVAVADLNGDLWPDIYVAHKGDGPDRDSLWLNDGDADADGSWDGTFSEWIGAQVSDVGRLSSAAMGVDIADYDGDGDLDVFVTDLGTMDLYRNRLVEDGHFSLEVVEPNPLASPDFGWGTSFADYDNDGHLDLYVATNYGVMDWLHRSNGVGGWADVTVDAGVALARESHAPVPADYDRDGRVDLLVVPRGEGIPVALYRNETSTTQHWLQVELVGDPDLTGSRHRSTAGAVGARVDVAAGGFTRRRDVDVGGIHCASTRDTLLTFGLGASTIAQEIEITWPSGRVERLFNVPADQRLTLVEGVPYAPPALLAAPGEGPADDDGGEAGVPWRHGRGRAELPERPVRK